MLWTSILSLMLLPIQYQVLGLWVRPLSVKSFTTSRYKSAMYVSLPSRSMLQYQQYTVGVTKLGYTSRITARKSRRFSFLDGKNIHTDMVALQATPNENTIESNDIDTTSSSTNEQITDTDKKYLSLAVSLARNGYGHTFPNPAVGCVLVSNMDKAATTTESSSYNVKDDMSIIGAGFHPKAGYPHAEVFALWQAAGHLDSGVDAALSIVGSIGISSNNDETTNIDGQKEINYRSLVDKLLEQYVTEDGPQDLLEDCLSDRKVTAYVTLEPCSHYGRTPPCAVALALAAVDRVVVGYCDPNPAVNGKGIALLKSVGTVVDVLTTDDDDSVHKECGALVRNFCKRIAPRDESDEYIELNGGSRRALRALANKLKSENKLVEVHWPNKYNKNDINTVEQVENLLLVPSWMERLDTVLWDNELVLLRLNKVVNKKKLAKILGERVASSLDAQVAQTLGHSVLLYRTGIPAVLDLQQLVVDYKTKNKNVEGEEEEQDDDNDDE